MNPKEGSRTVSNTQHGLRVVALMVCVAALLGWIASRADLLFADGLRYVAQAQRLERGAWRDGLLKSVDQPVYPLAIAATHGWRGDGTAASWQGAGQAASVCAGVLLVIPLYLVALELFGARSAWIAVVLFFGAPLTGHILADVLSEGTFLLFWMWGLWAALRFLREGFIGWLPLVIVSSGLAYLTRPEGALLPAALVLALLLIPMLRSARMNWPRWWAAIGVLVIGPALVLGPYVVGKGGIASKPAVARLLGLSARSPADAVERAEPFDPNQSEVETHLKAVKTVFGAIRDLVTPWLLPFAVVGAALAFQPGNGRARVATFLAILTGATVWALIRLHVTGGYCTPRHAIVLGALLCAAAAHGLERVLGSLVIPGRRLGIGDGRFALGPAVWVLVLGVFLAGSIPSMGRRLNHAMVGYREAGEWLSKQGSADGRVADATGWSLFYGQQNGYTFATLHDALSDPSVRYVVAREAHLQGPWWYCRLIREMVGSREPIATFPPNADKGQSIVYLFDRQSPEVANVAWSAKAEQLAK